MPPEKKTIIYYTSTYFFDISLEIINVIKTRANVHVLIEITPGSKNANIINIDKLPAGKPLISAEELLSKNDYASFSEYFKGTKSVTFVIHGHASGFSLNTLRVTKAVASHIRNCKPDIIQFEGVTLRTLGLAPLAFFTKKLVITIHDAVLHSGEANWKSKLPRYIFFKLPKRKTFLFYSNYSKAQFKEVANPKKASLLLLEMHPFSYFKKISESQPNEHKHILFFGRISKYKGVNILLDAFPQVLKNFPGEKLVIAGKGADNEILTHKTMLDFPGNITLLNKYIENNELVRLIKEAKLIICPYLDATQSGVLMTTFALNKPAIATETGAFPEQIINDFNGFLVPVSNPGKLSEKINQCLKNSKYLDLEQNIKNENQKNKWDNNGALFQKIYLDN